MSHEQNDFKKKYVYGLDPSIGQEGQVKTQEEALRQFKQEIGQKLDSEFAGKPAPDVNSFLIKDEQ